MALAAWSGKLSKLSAAGTTYSGALSFKAGLGFSRSSVALSAAACSELPEALRACFGTTPASAEPAPGAAAAASSGSAGLPGALPKRAPVLDFTDTKEAYKSKSTGQLIHALAVFSMCTFKPMVSNAEVLLKTSRKIFGDRFVEALIRPTFFRYFCAGEDGESIRPKVNFLRSYNVGGILDYAAEADVEQAGVAQAGPTKSSGGGAEGRYADHDERVCDGNTQIFRDCIKAVHNVTPEGFAAIKMTALCNPVLIERLSTVIIELRNTFYAMNSAGAAAASATASAAADEVPGSADVAERVVPKAAFLSGLRKCFDGLTEAEMESLFARMDVDHSGAVDVFEWTCVLDMQELLALAAKANANAGTLYKVRLDAQDNVALARMLGRLKDLAELALQQDVRLMVDAEQTYFQPAIDLLVTELQRKHNKERAVVWGTYQCYLRDSHRRLLDDLKRAKNEGFKWGAKLVRGAYMAQETARATSMGYANPIWPNIEATHANYNRCLAFVLTKLHRANVLVASHNQASAEFATSEMAARGIDRGTGGVYFGQLLGMADHLTFTLGQAGYKAYKYVPYGPIMEVVPYLVRRAQENSNIMGGVGIEKKLIWQELVRRKFLPVARAAPVRTV